MRLANSLINKRYFFFKTKQMLPYVTIMTLVGVAVTFVMNLIIASDSYYDMHYIIADGQLLFPSWAFMYIYPILMALSLFSFMHKKNASDLFAAAPVTKREYYLTNMLIAAIYFAAMILVMMLVSVFTINLLDGSGIPQTVAFDAFIKIFLFLFLGFMQVYTITATAATLTGTVPAQLFTAAVMLLIPTAVLMIFQFPNLMFVDTTFSTATHMGESGLILNGTEANSVIYPLNIATSPLSIIFIALNSQISDAYGLMTHFTDTHAMLYTLAIIVVYTILGVEFFSKYKMENVERPFINEKFGLVIRALMFIPIITFCIELFTNDGSVFNEIFITLFVIITVAYIVADLILRKGVKGLSRSLITYGICCIASIVFGLTLGHIINVNDMADPLLIKENDISKITVYMEPLNMTPYYEENVKKYYIPIEITDEKIISEIVNVDEKDSEYSSHGNLWIEVNANGKKYFAKRRFSLKALDSVYEIIDNDTLLKKTLFVNTGMSKHVKADVILAYANDNIRTNKSYMTTLKKRSEIKDIRSEFEEKLLEMPCREIYAMKMDNAFINNYWLISDGDEFGDNNAAIYILEIKYHDGMYYLSASEMAYGTEEFEDVIHSFDDEIMHLAVKQDYSTFKVSGSINLSNERIMNLENVLYEMPQALKKEFRELVINTLDEEIIYDNSIIFSVNYRNRKGYFILNYERDLEPLIEKYADYICETIATKAVGVSFGCYQYGDLSLQNLGPENQEAALAELRSNLPKIKELFLKKYSDDDIPLELFKGSVNYWVTDDKKHLASASFILDTSFETVLAQYLEQKEKCEDIVEIRFYDHEMGKEVSFQKDDGLVYQILLHSVILERSEYYRNSYYEYYDKCLDVALTPDSSYNPFMLRTEAAVEVAAVDTQYYAYTQYYDATIVYSDGTEEFIGLRLSPKAYTKFKQLTYAQ